MKNFNNLHFLVMSLLAVFVCVSCAHSQKHHKAGHHRGYDKHLWKKMDTNKDHQISHEEYTNAHSRKFKKIDTDGDNVISKEEKKAWKKKKKHKKASKHSDKHASCGHKDKKRCDCKKAKKYKKHKWKKMDTNQDGQISQEEFVNAMNKKFEKMDTDGDKAISKEEKKAWKKKKKKKMKEWYKERHKKDSDKEASADQPEEKDTVAEAKPAEDEADKGDEARDAVANTEE